MTRRTKRDNLLTKPFKTGGMVSKASWSSTSLKRKRSSGTPSTPIHESPSKKRKTSPSDDEDDIFKFPSDSDESDIEVTTKSVRQSPKLETLSKSGNSHAKTNGVKKVNASATSSRHSGNVTSKRKRKRESASPTPSVSIDEIVTETIDVSSPRPVKTPTKSKSRNKGSIVNGSSPPSPVKMSVVQKIQKSSLKAKKDEKEIKQETPDKVKKRVNDVVLTEKVSVNGVETKSTRSQEKRPSAQEFASVKIEVLSKLCNRTPIPLVGKAIEAAE